MPNRLFRGAAALILAGGATLALAQSGAAPAAATAPVQVDAAWARPSVPGQVASGAFMRLTAREPMQLVGVRTPVAGVAEVHEMKLEGDVMRMRAMPALALPAGQAVELKPGGLHLMLMDLKAPLVRDTQVPVTLLLRDARGAQQQLTVQVPVRAAAPGGGEAGAAHSHKH